MKLPPDKTYMAPQAEHACGLFFLVLSIGLTSWLGSSYELISMLNHLLWMNYNVLDQLGRGMECILMPVWDTLIQQAPAPLTPSLIRLKNVMRFDEQGLAEKEAVLRWITHLITHLGLSVGLSGQSASASITGYTLGTACAGSTSWAVENIMQSHHQNPDSIQIAQTLVYLTVYAMAYQQGYALAHHHLGINYDRITDTQALQRFGLYPGASEPFIINSLSKITRINAKRRPARKNGLKSAKPIKSS